VAVKKRSALRTFSVGAAAATALMGVAAAARDAHASAAHAARTLSINESGHLHRTSGHGITLNQTLNEQGSASGTINGSIYIHLRVISTNRVSAEVNIYPNGGSVTGYAGATYRYEGSTAGFSGSMSVARGTGHYSHAHGTGLSFYGSIRRSDDAITVYLRGRMYD
jgi:hypothetical protein